MPSVSLPFAEHEASDVAGGLFLSLVHLWSVVMQMRVAIKTGQPVALDAMSMATASERHVIYRDAVRAASVGLPAVIAERFMAQADAIAAQIFGGDIVLPKSISD